MPSVEPIRLYPRWAGRSFCLVILLIGPLLGSVLSLGTFGSTQEDLRESRPIGEIRGDVKVFVKHSKTGQDWNQRIGAVIDLCALHREIVNDPRLGTHNQLKSFRAQIAARLKKFQKELEVWQKRETRAAQTEGRLAARLNSPPQDGSERDSSERGKSDDWYDEMNQSMDAFGDLVGGPTNLFRYLGGNYAPPFDYAEDLIQLIESTIAPDSWQRNGGEGRMFYYRPSRILIVGATMKVQDEITDMLRQLRFMSR